MYTTVDYDKKCYILNVSEKYTRFEYDFRRNANPPGGGLCLCHYSVCRKLFKLKLQPHRVKKLHSSCWRIYVGDLSELSLSFSHQHHWSNSKPDYEHKKAFFACLWVEFTFDFYRILKRIRRQKNSKISPWVLTYCFFRMIFKRNP